jgi:hypothetical protein
MKRLLVLLFNAIALLGFAAAADTIPPLRPPRPPQNAHLAPHVHLGRSEQMMLTNLVVFIRFADEEEFSETLAPIDQMFNDTAYQQISVNNYFHSMTYGKINYHTVFTNDIQDTTIISYQDAHPHAYYQPRSSSNPEGYSGMGPALLRRNVMLANAMEYVDSLHLVDSTVNLDGNNDGLIDNISFILKCDIDDWDDLLWPQMDFFDTVSFDVNLLEVSEKTSSLTNHHKKTASAVVILLVDLEVLGKVIDPLCKKSDLNLGRTCVALVKSVLLHYSLLFFF